MIVFIRFFIFMKTYENQFSQMIMKKEIQKDPHKWSKISTIKNGCVQINSIYAGWYGYTSVV